MEHNRFIRWMGENIADIYQRKTIDYFDSSNHLICPKNHPHIPMIGVGFSFTRRWIRLRLASNTQNYTLKKKEKCIYHFSWQVLTISHYVEWGIDLIHWRPKPESLDSSWSGPAHLHVGHFLGLDMKFVANDWIVGKWRGGVWLLLIHYRVDPTFGCVIFICLDVRFWEGHWWWLFPKKRDVHGFQI